jgi:membrane peptidoglycan carboxypeptidase
VGYTSDLVAGVWMGFDKPQKIKSNAQGGILAAPAWTSFMNEVYRRKPAPRDWPMPADIVTRQIDVTTNMLATAYCPRSVVGSEFFIPGTDPVSECTAHTSSTLYPDTSGLGGYPPYPPGTAPGSTYVPRSLPPGVVDTSRTSVVVPGRVGRPQIDSSRRYRDTSIFVIPRRDTTYRPTRPDTLRRDTSRIRPPDTSRIRPRDTSRIRPPDTSRIRPPYPPDTTRGRLN